MPGDTIDGGLAAASGASLGAADQALTLDLHVEEIVVAKRVHRTLVRATRTTSERPVTVDEDLARETVVVERVAIGRYVDEVPPTRQEGDVTIMPVMEEEVVVTRRLVLKEEIHLRRIRTIGRHVETVALREQTVTVTRTPLED